MNEGKTKRKEGTERQKGEEYEHIYFILALFWITVKEELNTNSTLKMIE